MILLASSSDLVQVVTGQSGTIDVHTSWVDYLSGAVTPGRTNTAITTATTTTVCGSPTGSTVRNLKTLHIRNRHATSSCDITVKHTDGTTAVELHKVTLTAGQALEYIEGLGFYILPASPVSPATGNANTADVTASAADTYLTGSNLTVGGRIQAGTWFRWRFTMTKTAAGVATPIYTVRAGTAGTTADASVGTATGVAQTAATDTGWHEIEAVVRSVSATSTGQITFRQAHKNATTGLANVAQDQIFQTAFSSIDLTSTSLIFGVSCNPGASGVWTFQTVSVLVGNLKLS